MIINRMNRFRIIKKEKTKPYLIKVLCAKILIGRGYDIYSEFDCLRNPAFNTQRIPKIYAINKKLKKRSKIFIEIENSITNSKKLELSKYYEGYILYLIKINEVPNDIYKMEEYLEKLLGFNSHRNKHPISQNK